MDATFQSGDYYLRQLKVLEGSESLPGGIDPLEALIEEELDGMFIYILDLQIQINNLRETLGRTEKRLKHRQAMLRRAQTREMALRAELIGDSQ